MWLWRTITLLNAQWQHFEALFLICPHFALVGVTHVMWFARYAYRLSAFGRGFICSVCSVNSSSRDEPSMRGWRCTEIVINLLHNDHSLYSNIYLCVLCVVCVEVQVPGWGDAPLGAQSSTSGSREKCRDASYEWQEPCSHGGHTWLHATHTYLSCQGRTHTHAPRTRTHTFMHIAGQYQRGGPHMTLYWNKLWHWSCELL